MKFAYAFREATNESLALAGGKGASLCRMFQARLPVPDGFVILSAAFAENRLKPEAMSDIDRCLSGLPDTLLAVRSSALSEDSAKTSFAGAFESVLEVQKKDIYQAIDRVAASAVATRVREYSKAHGIEDGHQIAVVVQIMIQADLAGVLFTADPITGSHVDLVGNFVFGAGEQLVAGTTNPYPFTISRNGAKYQGNSAFAAYAKALHKAAQRIEKIFARPMDIEWVVARHKLYIVQARPITTLETINLDTYAINQSLDTDALWTSNNVGEAIPDVMSPFTWSLLREMDLECQKVPGYFMFGNICGRTYSNISVMLSSLKVLGYSMTRAKELIVDVFGRIPDHIAVPVYPFATANLIKEMFIGARKSLKRMRDSRKQQDYYLEHTPVWYVATLAKIKGVDNRQALYSLWTADVRPFLSALWYIWFGGAGSATLVTLRKKLSTMVAEEQANLLCSNFSGSGVLASMQPMLAIESVAKGTLTKEKYLELYGHRSPHEFDVYYPYPADDPDYIDRQMGEYNNLALNPSELLQKQQAAFAKAKELFRQKYPHKQKWLDKKLATVAKDAGRREALRNEFIKVFRVMRHLLLQIGAVTGIGDDIFMMYCFEVPAFLQGDNTMLDKLAARRKTFAYYQTLPVFPQLIRGRFMPEEWLKEENRRQDYYGPHANKQNEPTDGVVQGFAGAPGTVTGKVRVLHSFDQSATLQKGEILVTTMTNIGWTPLFPKAAAIVTDLGAPLSHAAIVARELGIPAVVGTGNATTTFKTGDMVLVNGNAGIVSIARGAYA